ncbi:hypothetical protein [Bradyrhizobium elkanii]|uniref:hypothetical protein n=1 Tax=Bradyrhizobium elkanii TaxID=29448 RepID=UPI0012FD38DA|nr:hypothetical protein [Bradyrhizobium elkanii]
MSGLLRGLILRRHELPEAVEALWRETPDQRHRYLALVAQECGFTSQGKAVLRDLLMLMFREHDGYLDAITIELSRVFADRAKCEANSGIARNGSYEMAYEYKDLAAWHLAANRALARLRLLPVPLTLPGRAWKTGCASSRIRMLFRWWLIKKECFTSSPGNTRLPDCSHEGKRIHQLFFLPAETKVMVPEDLMMYVTGA